MDTTDPDITFDRDGVSSWVKFFRERVAPLWRAEGDPERFRALIRRIKEDGRGREYDCALGLSGGVDSSYLAYIAKREGLRPLVVHTDAGWNSDIAVSNIEKIVKNCGFDLATVVIDWEQMADVQRAFLMAGVPNQDIPQDHVIFSAFYGFAAKHRVKWLLSGHNYACESVLPRAWGHDARDVRHIRAIHRRFGRRALGDFPLMSHVRFGLHYTLALGMRVASPLNLIPYSQDAAIHTLKQEFDWRYYGGKHFESRWTRFFQAWWLPTKFGYDKRLAHLSSQILSGQISRDEALERLAVTTYSQTMLEEDRALILKKLDVTSKEFDALLAAPGRSHDEYPTSRHIPRGLAAGRSILRAFGLLRTS